MLCVRDVTELKALAAEAGQQKRELEMIGQVLAVNQEKFHQFVDSSMQFIDENQEHHREDRRQRHGGHWFCCSATCTPSRAMPEPLGCCS
jgi:two-component system chemotaxis sensor kinase CheA